MEDKYEGLSDEELKEIFEDIKTVINEFKEITK